MIFIVSYAEFSFLPDLPTKHLACGKLPGEQRQFCFPQAQHHHPLKILSFIKKKAEWTVGPTDAD
jgi:hypothetical protein